MKKILFTAHSKLHMEQLLENLKKELDGNDSELLLVMKPTLQTTMDLCEKLKKYTEATIGDKRGRIIFVFQINSVNTSVLKIIDPNTPYAVERLSALKYAFNNGFRTSVEATPVIDNGLIELVYKTQEFVTDYIFVDIVSEKYVNSIIDILPKQLLRGAFDNYQRYNILKEIQNALSENEKVIWGDNFPKSFQNTL